MKTTERWTFPPGGIEPGHEYHWESPEEREAYDRWMALPIKEREAVWRAQIGMMAGDLRPLAELLRSGFDLGDYLTNEIANSIEEMSSDGFRLKMVLRPGQKTPEFKWRNYQRDFELYSRVEVLRRAALSAGENGVSDSIFSKVAAESGVGEKTVRNAHARFRQE